MKKTSKALIVLAAAAIALAACTAQQNKAVEEMVTEEFSTPEGGYVIPAESASALTEEEAAIFADAIEGLTGVGYEPVAVLATQMVSGTNRAYLCKGTVVVPNGETSWYVVKVYTNLDGVSEIGDIKEFDINNPAISEEAPENVLGGWSAVKPAANALPADAAEAFAKGTEALLGANYTPIALLGTSDAGPYYLVIAYGETVTATPKSSIYLVQVLANGTGAGVDVNAAKSVQLDLLSYV